MMNFDKKIKYVLPDFTCIARNEILIDIYEKYPEIVRDDTCIYSFFGVFPNAIWNGGGTTFCVKNRTEKEMKKIKKFYEKHGIVVTFTFTNSLIEEKHLDDEYCNKMLEIFENGKNEVLVVSPILEKYIRKNYPGYKINRSIIASEKKEYDADNYNITVLQKFKNNNFEYLNQIPKEKRSNIELLCNEACVDNCKFGYSHYKEHANIQLGIIDSRPNYGLCKYYEEPQFFYYNRMTKSKYRITPEDIITKYVPMGFQYFKLGGRGISNFHGTLSIVNYCIKPEYQSDVFVYLLERLILDYEKLYLFRLSIAGDTLLNQIESEIEYI